MFIVSSAIPSPNAHTFIVSEREDLNDAKEYLKGRYPLITFYTGEVSEITSEVLWDTPQFPKHPK